jgi:hypothetical protein
MNEATKQSILPLRCGMDCVASLAKTTAPPHCVIFLTAEYLFRKLSSIEMQFSRTRFLMRTTDE